MKVSLKNFTSSFSWLHFLSYSLALEIHKTTFHKSIYTIIFPFKRSCWIISCQFSALWVLQCFIRFWMWKPFVRNRWWWWRTIRKLLGSRSEIDWCSFKLSLQSLFEEISEALRLVVQKVVTLQVSNQNY